MHQKRGKKNHNRKTGLYSHKIPRHHPSREVTLLVTLYSQMTKFKSFWAAKKIFCFLCKHRFAPKHSSLRYLKLQMWWVDKIFTEFACWWNQSKGGGGGGGGSIMIFYIAPFFTISPMSAWPIHLGENKGRCIFKVKYITCFVAF